MKKNLQNTNRFFIKQPNSCQLDKNAQLLLALNFGLTKVENQKSIFEITLPKNWNVIKENNLLIFVDEKKRNRINCFYVEKDENLFLIENLKFLNFFKLNLSENAEIIRITITDNNSKIWFNAQEFNNDSERPFDSLLKAASNFLFNTFPDWENPLSYWD